MPICTRRIAAGSVPEVRSSSQNLSALYHSKLECTILEVIVFKSKSIGIIPPDSTPNQDRRRLSVDSAYY